MSDDRSQEERTATLLEAWESRSADPDTWEAIRAEARFGPTLHLGEIVGDRYQLRRHAGDGPLAATWAAWDALDRRWVGLKILHGQHATDPAGLVAFHRAASHAQDPGGEWQGFHWFAVDGEPGPTLHERVTGGQLDPAGALVLVVEAGQILAGMHAKKQLHGLVSPDAIRLDPTGAAQLHDAGLFTPRAAMGMAWLAPERLDPTGVAGAAADVYGLAMSTLFALHGGELPFWAWRSPERLVEALDPPPEVRAALLEAVSWDPQARTVTIAELVQAILDSVPLRRTLAAACVRAGRPRAALQHLDALADAHPDDPDLLAERARALDALGDPLGEAAWRDAFEAHRTRPQAKTALEALVDRAEGAELVERGRALLPLLAPDARVPLEHRLGKVLLDELSDAEGALPLLAAALEGGHPDPLLAALVEKLRTERGDWTTVQADWIARGELQKARAVARFALRTDTTELDRALRDAAEDAGFTGPGEALARVLELFAAGSVTEAEQILKAVAEAHPDHLGVAMALGESERRSGRLESSWAQWDRVARATEGLGLSDIDRRQEHARAELAWLRGEIPLAAELWHRRLDADADDRVAWWGLARAAFSCPKDQPWFGATPAVFTPEEALARLLAGLMAARTATRWLDLPEATLARGPVLGVCAAVVDALIARGAVGPALFETLSERYPEAGLPIEAVRWLWCEPASEPLFAVRDSYRWTGQEERFDARVERRLMHLHAPRLGPTELSSDIEPLLNRKSGSLPIEKTFGKGTPAAAPERPLRTVITSAEVAPLELEGQRRTIGGDVDDDMLIDGLPPARVAFERTGEHWYLTADPEVELDGMSVGERRVLAGQRYGFEGVLLRVYSLAPGAPIPEDHDDVLLDLPEGWPVDGPHAVLVHHRGAEEELVPFSEDVLALGSDPDEPVVSETEAFLYRLRRTDSGYTLEDRTGTALSELPAVLPLQHGDSFAIGDRTFTFQVKGVQETPAIALDRLDRRATVPLLVYRDTSGEEQLLPVLEDVFSIGRGGGNDMQINDDEVSRHHCMLVRGTDGACILRDAGSANGTQVNGRSIERHILQVGDQIGIGNCRMEFRLGRREDLEADLPDLALEEVEETTTSRADTAAFRRPTREDHTR